VIVYGRWATRGVDSDINGDRHVDITDFVLFSVAIFNPANYIAAFDFNNDGHIDIADWHCTLPPYHALSWPSVDPKTIVGSGWPVS
jgi:Dockerin type I domain